jgi:hypothetical protein
MEYSTGNLTFFTGKIIHENKIDSTGNIVILYMTVKQQPFRYSQQMTQGGRRGGFGVSNVIFL